MVAVVFVECTQYAQKVQDWIFLGVQSTDCTLMQEWIYFNQVCLVSKIFMNMGIGTVIGSGQQFTNHSKF